MRVFAFTLASALTAVSFSHCLCGVVSQTLGSMEYVQDSKGRVIKPLALVNYGNPTQSGLAWKPPDF